MCGSGGPVAPEPPLGGRLQRRGHHAAPVPAPRHTSSPRCPVWVDHGGFGETGPSGAPGLGSRQAPGSQSARSAGGCSPGWSCWSPRERSGAALVSRERSVVDVSGLALSPSVSHLVLRGRLLPRGRPAPSLQGSGASGRAVAFATHTPAGPPRGCSPGNAHCASPRPRQTGRSAFQCLQKYQQHNRALKRREWTPEEDHLLTQLVREMRVGSHIPYRRSESARTRPCRWAPEAPPRVEAARSPQARGVAQSRVPTPPLRPQLSTTWKGETPCSSSIGGPRAWTPT